MVSPTTSALDVLFNQQAGGVAVGLLTQMEAGLKETYCPVASQYTRVLQCPAFLAVRQQLWMDLGLLLCGLTLAEYTVVVSKPIPERLEFMLTKCGAGQLASGTEVLRGAIGAVQMLLLMSVLRQVTIATVVAFNDAQAQRRTTTTNDDISALNPEYYVALGPIPTAAAAPTVLARQQPSDANLARLAGGAHGSMWPAGSMKSLANNGTPDGVFPFLAINVLPPCDALTTSSASILGAASTSCPLDTDTAVFPQYYILRNNRVGVGTVLYHTFYAQHPSPKSRWDTGAVACARLYRPATKSLPPCKGYWAASELING